MAKRMPVAAGGGWAAPDPVLDLAAVADGIGGVTLTWTQAFGATGYDIQRSLTNGNFASIETDQTGATYYDSSGDPNTLYYYRIIAKRGQVPSLPSNVASATTGSAFIGVLDSYTSNLAVAWSLTRRLLSSYTGALFRVRADRSGQPEQDIGYLANGDVDTAALQTFVGSDSAYLVTAYRQDGSSDHPTQATAANQPRVVLAGVLDDGALFIGTQFLTIPSTTAASITDGSNIQVVIRAQLDSGVNARTFSFNTDDLGAYLQYGGTLYWDAPVTTGRISGAQPAGYNTGSHITSLERAGATSSVRIDGTEEITGAVSGTISGTSPFVIGALSSGTNGMAGHLYEFVLWKDCASPATRAALLA